MLKAAVVALLTVVVAVVLLGLPSGLYKLLELLSCLRTTQAGWFCLGVLVYPAAKTIQSRSTHSDAGDDKRKDVDGSIYGLHHGRLNIALPPPTMWMNMGYWELTSEFPIACRALLEEVLIDAKLLPRQDRSKDFKRPHTLTIIDLGFGCGDQTVYLMNEIFQNMSLVDSFTGIKRRRLIDRYVGVTESHSQFKFTENRLTTLGLLGGKNDGPPIEIFCADAAQPASWSDELARAAKEKAAPPPSTTPYLPTIGTIAPLPLAQPRAARQTNPPPSGNSVLPTLSIRAGLQSGTDRESFHRQTWVLALDTLYHFSPSRQPILNHAYRELEASLMGFDLMLADEASSFDRALLAAMSLFAAIPFSNFLTAAQYRKMLVSAGYAEENIVFRDISKHVFAPLARFMDKKDKELGLIGLGIGYFRVPKWIFQWWAKSGVVRGVIVVARR